MTKRKARKKLLEDRSFFEPKSLDELARSQGAGPVKDIRVFAGVIRDDEDVDQMLEEINRFREPVPSRPGKGLARACRGVDNDSCKGHD
jgi:hypothetical protein